MLVVLIFLCGSGARQARKALRFLEVILHIGAHRTATSSLQAMLHQNRSNLSKNGVAYWGPKVTRGGVFAGLLRTRGADTPIARALQAKSVGRVALRLKKLDQRRLDMLVISDENILGSMRNNLRENLLYPDLENRLGRFNAVLGESCRRVCMAIRPYHHYWASTLAFSIPGGQAAPDAPMLNRLATSERTWRNVVTDVAFAFPDAEVLVWEFDRVANRPDWQFDLISARRVRLNHRPERRNQSPNRAQLRSILTDRGALQEARTIAPGEGAYMPFSADQIAQMKRQYEQDVRWLRRATTRRNTGVRREPFGARLQAGALG